MNTYTLEFWQEMWYLAGIYGWDDDVRAEMKAWVLANRISGQFCEWHALCWHAAEAGLSMLPFDLWIKEQRA